MAAVSISDPDQQHEELPRRPRGASDAMASGPAILDKEEATIEFCATEWGTSS
jgi:hypothetical protein